MIVTLVSMQRTILPVLLIHLLAIFSSDEFIRFQYNGGMLLIRKSLVK